MSSYASTCSPRGSPTTLRKRLTTYGKVHRRAKEIVQGEPVNLIETVAERVATTILQDHPLVEAVRVKVAKPHVRLDDTILASSTVEILRRRDTGSG